MIDDVFRERLLDGEKVVWSGRPGRGILLTGRDALMIPFSLLWGGFAAFWETNVVRTANAPVLMKLFGIPFIFAGIYLIFGRFILDFYIRTKTYYAVTDQRILIMRSHPFPSLTALSIDRLPDLRLTESSSGRGTIYFGPQCQAFSRDGFGAWTPSLDATPKFMTIENARSVFSAIHGTIMVRG